MEFTGCKYVRKANTQKEVSVPLMHIEWFNISPTYFRVYKCKVKKIMYSLFL